MDDGCLRVPGLFIKVSDPKLGQEIAVAIEKEAILSNGCKFAFAMVIFFLLELKTKKNSFVIIVMKTAWSLIVFFTSLKIPSQ
jgi:hypothetical protein